MFWYENEARYTCVGSVEFGYNSIHDFDLYRDNYTGEIVVGYHDDYDTPTSIQNLIEFSNGYRTNPDKYSEQLDAFDALLKQLNIIKK